MIKAQTNVLRRAFKRSQHRVNNGSDILAGGTRKKTPDYRLELCLHITILISHRVLMLACVFSTIVERIFDAS